MSLIAENYLRIKNEIEASLQKMGRASSSAKILVVSKGQNSASLQELCSLKQFSFGENYVQEWRLKKEELKKLPLQWHFIGRLQSNKLKYLMGEISLFHSLDRWELAQKMNDASAQKNITSQVLIEVDLAHEESKTGIKEKDLKTFVEKMNELTHLSLKGFMLFPPPTEDPENSRPYYRHLSEILFEFNQKNVYKDPLTELSMGMSNDYRVAVEEGATWLRIGRAMFENKDLI